MSPPLLNTNELRKLGRIAGMFGSVHDGEVASAARRAHCLLVANGTTLSAVLERYEQLEAVASGMFRPSDRPVTRPTHSTAPRAVSPNSREHDRAKIDLLRSCPHLSDWERGFIESLHGMPTLKDGQRRKLREIYQQHWKAAA